LQAIADALRRPLVAGVLVALASMFMTESASSDRGVRAAAAGEMIVERGDRGDAVRRVQRALGVAADGVFGPQTERAVRRFQRRRGLLADGIVGPRTRAALGLEPFSARSLRRSSSGGIPRALRLIAECESGGDPTAVSPGGIYRGKYQFSIDTWRALGGEGDPADAPEWLQDRLALRLYRRAGSAPWPSCA
jgi:Transglycosylase-like domain/Putative peptidoglycan binding domain